LNHNCEITIAPQTATALAGSDLKPDILACPPWLPRLLRHHDCPRAISDNPGSGQTILIRYLDCARIDTLRTSFRSTTTNHKSFSFSPKQNQVRPQKIFHKATFQNTRFTNAQRKPYTTMSTDQTTAQQRKNSPGAVTKSITSIFPTWNFFTQEHEK
jgi:hypothetical protein